MPLLKRIEHFVHGFDLRSTGKWFILSALVGVVAGVGAIAFQLCGQVVIHYTLGAVAGFSPGEALGEHSIFEHEAGDFHLGLLVAVVAVGGLASGVLVYSLAPEAEGHGTDAVIDAFHNKSGRVNHRVPIVKTIASAITIGTGGSGGREGPIAQIGAGFGSFLAEKLSLSARDRRIMLAAGMGAGVGAIFRAPLAGALFAGEILYKDADIESDVIVPTAISSIISYSVYGLLAPGPGRFTFMPLFGNDLDYQLTSLFQLLPLAALAIILVLVSVIYIKTFYGVHALFRKLPVKRHFRPAIGALLAGLAGVGLYLALGRDEHALAVLSTGYGTLQTALEDAPAVGVKVLLLVALVKIVTTSLTISSGGSGGVFGPSMVVGGCVGAAVGLLFRQYGIDPDCNPGVYAIVGMAGFFAGCAHAPISTIIMVSEMTGDYKLLLPTMWVSTLCFLLCRRWTLYNKQVATRLESPAHRGDFLVDVLEGITVKDVYSPDYQVRRIPESMSLDEIVHALAETNQHYFPVVDDEGALVGIFSSDDVRAYLYNETIWQLAVARDIMATNIVSVTPEDDLNTALQRFTMLNLDQLPVLDRDDASKLLGMIRRKDVIACYNRSLREHKQAQVE